ncbi:MAG: hypothetical protein ACO32I_07155 [Candidatus Limnocylindrus sp.]
MPAGRWGAQVCLDCAEAGGYCDTCTVARAMVARGTAPIEAAIASLQAELARRTEAQLFGHARRVRRRLE